MKEKSGSRSQPHIGCLQLTKICSKSLWRIFLRILVTVFRTSTVPEFNELSSNPQRNDEIEKQ